MSLALEEGEKVADGISRIIGERLDRALGALNAIHHSRAGLRGFADARENLRKKVRRPAGQNVSP